MNNSQQETSLDVQGTEFGGAAVSKQRSVIHFTSGETLEEEDSEEEEEEESPDRHPFREPAERTRFSFKSVAILVGRISLLACDFLGERLAGALGLNAAKYQYAIDLYRRDQESQTTNSQTARGVREGQAEAIHLSTGLERSHYEATADVRYPVDSHESCDEPRKDRREGCHNRGYQADEEYME